MILNASSIRVLLPKVTHRAFSMIELLVVIAVTGLVAALTLPAVSGLKSAGDTTNALYNLSGTLEQARTYAMAQNTYVWVGFFEEDGSRTTQAPGTAGSGRLILSVVASKDGTRYQEGSAAPFGAGDPSNPVTLIPLSKLIKADNIHVLALNGANNVPARPSAQPQYQLGHPSFSPNTAPVFTYPLSGSPRYTFSNIIEFNPRGEASKIGENVFSGPGPADVIEIAFVPTHGATLDPAYAAADSNKAAAAIQIEGFTGNIRIYRP